MTAKSINDLNGKAGRVLPLDEIQELAGKGKLLSDDKLHPDKRKNYALINQIRAVSKQRLSTFKYNGQYLKLKLEPEQMDIIDKGLLLLCKH